MSELNYIQASKHESFGGMGNQGVKILVAVGRNLNEEDEKLIRKATDELMEGLRRQTVLNDPKEIADRVKTREEMIAAFSAELPIFVEEIPNEYCSQSCCANRPWFIVTTPFGRIKIGWRKRVIHVEWTDSKIILTADDLFPNEDTTKSGRMIHAWGYEKAAEYLRVILAVAKESEADHE